MFGEEFPAIYWLEENGYDVSYISGIDAATNPALLLNTKTYIDVGHDEYWSQSQYDNVKAAADAGINEAFLSGNQTYWDIELAPSLDDSATPNRTIIEYKDIWSGAQLDPNGTSNGGAGLFRDPVYGPGAPENSLSGTIFTVDSWGGLDDITVPASMSQYRFWANTNIATNNGGTLTNLLGYEWDSDLNNGFRPAGLIDLSSTTNSVDTLLLDNGATTGPGTATHSLTLYRNPSGALIFGAGTVMWPWGLSDQHALYNGLTAPVSTAVQQSIVNLFADMGIQPGTLQGNLVAQGSADHVSPTATITSPTAGTSVYQGQTVTITGTATDVDGLVAGVEVSTDGGQTWQPATGKTNWSFTWTVSDASTRVIQARAIDDSVNLQSSPATLSLNVTGFSGSSLFTASNTPSQTTVNDGQQIEVGVKFQSSVAGQITALKFYRSPSDTGPDILDLWTATGTKLANATFTNNVASGWQTVGLATPVTINANTTYIASYHTTGSYVATSNFFASDFTNGVLTAPAGGNGVYGYGGTSTTGLFPTNTYNAENYYADVVFTSSTANNAVADVADATEKGGIANGSGGSPASGNVLTNDINPAAVTAVSFGAVAGTLGTALAGAHGSLVLNASGDFTYTVNETDVAVQALRQPTDTLTDVFTYTMSDTAGATSTAQLTVRILGTNDAPTLAAQTPNQNASVGSAFNLVLPAATFTDVDAGDALSYTATAADGSALPSWLAFSPTTRTFSGTPTVADVGTLGINVTATDLGSLTASETFNIAVATTAPTTVSLFSASATPSLTSLNDGQQLEVGVKFQSSVAGQITALKFYRSPSDTGADVLDLWTATGTKLASATFTNTTASGWQTVGLMTPVTISANTTYIASYHTTGAYAATDNFFTNALTSGVLTAPSTTTAGGNGVYAYGGTNTTGLFPTNTYSAANYYADVVFTSSATNTAPTAVADTADATEKGGIANGSGGSLATGNVLNNDTDPDAGDTKTVTAVNFGGVAGTVGTALAGAHGSLVLNASGAFTYTVDDTQAAVQALRQSTDTLTDVFNYTMRDTAGATSTTTLTVTIDGANDAPTLAAQTPNQNAIVGSAFYLVLPAATFNDVDAGDVLSYAATAADGSPLPGWLSFDTATRTFSGTPAVTDVGTLGVKVSATDIGGLAANETFNIAVTPTANTVPTAVADTADATEKGGIANGSGGSLATGNVLNNDTDPDAGDTKTVTAVNFGGVAGTVGTALAGAHGSLVLNASGAFTYTVDDTQAAVQALRQSTDTLTDVFNYTMRDTAGATSTTTLTVTIDGANDAPTLAAQTPNQNASVGSAFNLVLPAATFTDVDAGDALSYTATAADGSPLPGWLSFDTATHTFSGTPAADRCRHAWRQGFGH